MIFQDADFNDGISFMQEPYCRRLLRPGCWPEGSCKKHVIYDDEVGDRLGWHCFATIKTIETSTWRDTIGLETALSLDGGLLFLRGGGVLWFRDHSES